MIKYRFIGKKPNFFQKEEIDDMIHDNDFIKLLLLSLKYYIQGYHGDYGFVINEEGSVKKIEITIY